jgi:hypothetical protein
MNRFEYILGLQNILQVGGSALCKFATVYNVLIHPKPQDVRTNGHMSCVMWLTSHDSLVLGWVGVDMDKDKQACWGLSWQAVWSDWSMIQR